MIASAEKETSIGGAESGPVARVYGWTLAEAGRPAQAVSETVPLRNLAPGPDGRRELRGRFVTVRNAAIVNVPGLGGEPNPTAIGDIEFGEAGRLIFEPGKGGGRIDKMLVADAAFRARYIQAARFGEVNTYHHVDRIASYLDELLREIGASSLPPVVVVVNAHHAAADRAGARDGRRCPDGRWVPFQGGHYRLPGPAQQIPELAPLSPNGEIHLGPGQKLTSQGALARLAGSTYRANASHNPAIIYHEYGHHLCRHTADFRANRERPPGRQSNRKSALDEGTADYFTAAMLGTPHIWFFHHQDDDAAPHRRSLSSPRTMGEFLRGRAADPHTNGTIWSSALWALRTRASAQSLSAAAGARGVDRLVLQALLLIGNIRAHRDDKQGRAERPQEIATTRGSFRRAGAALLRADALLYRGGLRDTICRTLADRGIHPEGSTEPFSALTL